MILSFHPIIKADINVIVAGRPPNKQEKQLIQKAEAILLPQGVRADLYQLCTAHCRRVFPNYDFRFTHPGKIGDISLFNKYDMPHPKTFVFPCVRNYLKRYPPDKNRFPFSFPFIVKANLSGEGRLVFKVRHGRDLEKILGDFEKMERYDRAGFIAQEWVPHGGRDLRVVVLHDEFVSYWRVQQKQDEFRTNLAAGAIIDRSSDPHLQQRAVAVVRSFCRQSRINLAGIDLMYNSQEQEAQPLFTEINYWFGRRVFGSSHAYYQRLKTAVQRWLAAFEPQWADRIRLD
ncbi:MAG: glutathione synthase [Deltaproteobacteria bacterium]|nr:glutathione synthase [Deltaproteobacteria bacterium]MBW2069878.1 glutathione synthase [Deltaproteobacteria bacterium]